METFKQAMASVRLSRNPRLDWGDRRTILACLQFTYHLMRATESLLKTAVWEMGGWATKVGDPYSLQLLGYYHKHFEEERDHAAWMADDLATAGIRPQFIDTPLLAAEIAGAQYYLMLHVHPAILLGYLAAMEFFQPPVEFWDGLAEIHGKDMLRTMRFHSVADRDHAPELQQIIDVTSDPLRAAVHSNGIHTTVRLMQAAHTFKQEE